MGDKVVAKATVYSEEGYLTRYVSVIATGFEGDDGWVDWFDYKITGGGRLLQKGGPMRTVEQALEFAKREARKLGPRR